MEHVEAERLLALYADDELDTMTAGRLEAHLRECDACPPRLDSARRSRSILSEALRREAAPEDLRGRILDDIGRAQAEPSARFRPSAPWMRYAATVAATALLASAATVAITRSDPVPPLAATVINDHIRALATRQMTEVASADARPVRAWFQGRLSFAPPVAEAAGKGVSLIGARVDYIDGQPIAALVYGRGGHLISVFVRPALAGRSTAPASAVRQGYSCVHWGAGGFEYWAVSDIPKRELSVVGGLPLT